jgi:hypothetical protein
MAHFAEVDSNNIVQRVLVVANEEDYRGQEFLANDLGLGGTWLKTSYNTFGGVYYDPITNTPAADQTKSFRKNYAGIGFLYDATKDAFIPPKPFDFWVFNEQTCMWEDPNSIKPEIK